MSETSGEFDHSATQAIVLVQLYNNRHQYSIYVFPELRVQTGPSRIRVPDITVTKQKGKGRILREPPFLCIEVLSPEDCVSRMEAKIDDYLSFGVKYVWVIDPRRRKATSYTSEGKRESSTVLTTSGPDLTLSLDEVFAAVDEDLES